MGRRKGPQDVTVGDRRSAMLQGITDKAAVYLYDEAMDALESRGQADFVAALQLRDACQWTMMIGDIQKTLRSMMLGGESDGKRVAALIRNKQAAEDARRKILDGLQLTPRRPRGRPPKETTETDKSESDDEALNLAWDSFEDDSSPNMSIDEVDAP